MEQAHSLKTEVPILKSSSVGKQVSYEVDLTFVSYYYFCSDFMFV